MNKYQVSAIVCSAAMLVCTACGPAKDAASYIYKADQFTARGDRAQAILNLKKAIQVDPQSARAYYGLGLVHLQDSNILQAYGDIKRAVELDPSAAAPKAKLAEICRNAYLLDPKHPEYLKDELARLAADLLKLNPDSFEGHRLTGYSALVSEDMATSLKHFTRARELRTQDPEIALALSQVLFQIGRFKEGERIALSGIEQNPGYPALYDQLYLHYKSAKTHDRAEHILVTKCERNPDRPEFALQLCEHYLRSGKPGAIEPVLTRLRAQGKDGAARGKIGDFFARTGNLGAAIEEYGRAAAEAPADAARYDKRAAQAFVMARNGEAAIARIQQVLSRHPGDREALRIRVEAFLARGRASDIRAATSDLKTLTRETPDDHLVRYELGRAHLAARDFQAAKEQFLQALRVRNTFQAARIQLAEIAIRLGRGDEAARLTREVLTFEPESIQAKVLQAQSLALLGDTQQAALQLEVLLRKIPNAKEPMLRLGLIYLSTKEFAKAERLFLAVRVLDPVDSRPVEGLSELYIASRRPDRATALVDGEVARHPEDVALRQLLAKVYTRTGKVTDAIRQYEKAIELAPESVDVQLRLAETLLRTGQTARAIDIFRASLRAAPGDAAIEFRLATVLDTNGRAKEAIEMYRRLLPRERENAALLNNLAYSIARSGGDLGEALSLAHAALAKAPGRPEIRHTIGLIHLRNKQVSTALNVLEQLSSEHPASPSYRLTYAQALVQSGNHGRARGELGSALASSPDATVRSAILELLSSIDGA